PQCVVRRRLVPLPLVSVRPAFACADGGVFQHVVRQRTDRIKHPSRNPTPNHSTFPRGSTGTPYTQLHTCNNDGCICRPVSLLCTATYSLHIGPVRAVNNCAWNALEKTADSYPAAFELFPSNRARQDEVPPAKLL